MANTYITKQGDMWDSIASKVYGSEYQMHYLMEANTKYVETVVFAAGIELVAPELPTTQKTNLPPWRRRNE